MNTKWDTLREKYATTTSNTSEPMCSDSIMLPKYKFASDALVQEFAKVATAEYSMEEVASMLGKLETNFSNKIGAIHDTSPEVAG